MTWAAVEFFFIRVIIACALTVSDDGSFSPVRVAQLQERQRHQCDRSMVARYPQDLSLGKKYASMHFVTENSFTVVVVGINGTGVNVAIIDDGLDMTSEDLAPNFVSSQEQHYANGNLIYTRY